MSFLTFAEFFEMAIRVFLEYVKQNKMGAKVRTIKVGEKFAAAGKYGGSKLELEWRIANLKDSKRTFFFTLKMINTLNIYDKLSKSKVEYTIIISIALNVIYLTNLLF